MMTTAGSHGTRSSCGQSEPMANWQRRRSSLYVLLDPSSCRKLPREWQDCSPSARQWCSPPGGACAFSHMPAAAGYGLWNGAPKDFLPGSPGLAHGDSCCRCVSSASPKDLPWRGLWRVAGLPAALLPLQPSSCSACSQRDM